MSDAKQLLVYADIVGSEKILREDNKRWENLLQPTLDRLNKHYQQVCHIPFETVAGDSFGAIVKDLPSAVAIVLSIQEMLQQTDARIVLIRDSIQYGMDGQHFNQLQGQALWKANEAINQLKKDKTLFLANLGDKRTDLSLNSIVNLMMAIRKKWSATTWAIYQHYCQGNKQKTIAERVGVSQQYVSKALNDQNIRLISRTQRDTIALLEQIEAEDTPQT